MTVCRTCGAPIRWARTERGARIPLDIDPTDRGVFIVTGRDRGDVTVRTAHDGDDPMRYQSHFATCPDAASWRAR